jgi:hypothetical protein
MNEPRTRHDALFAELASDIDAILPRVEALLPKLVDINRSIQSAAAGFDAAADRHTTTFAGIQTQAMKGLGEFAARRTQQAVVKSAAEQEAILQAVVKDAFATHLLPALRSFNQTFATASSRGQTPSWSSWSTWLAVSVCAVVTSVFTVVALSALQRL